MDRTFAPTQSHIPSPSKPSAQYDGKRLDKEYVGGRAKWEPLYEVTQIKGDGEAHPFLSPDDEFADYETRDIGNLDDPPGSDLFSATVGPVARKNSRAKPILEIDFIVGLLVNL